MSFILGMILIPVGFVITWKSDWLMDNFGRIGFFENNLQTSGGSRLGYKLIGIFVVFLGILAITGMIGGFMEWALEPLLKYSRRLGEIQ